MDPAALTVPDTTSPVTKFGVVVMTLTCHNPEGWQVSEICSKKPFPSAGPGKLSAFCVCCVPLAKVTKTPVFVAPEGLLVPTQSTKMLAPFGDELVAAAVGTNATIVFGDDWKSGAAERH
jgi:hypothetical protein